MFTLKQAKQHAQQMADFQRLATTSIVWLVFTPAAAP